MHNIIVWCLYAYWYSLVCTMVWYGMVDVCTMVAKPVMYLCFCRQLLPKVPGWKKRPSPLSAPAKQNNPNDHQHQICSKYCLANKTSKQTMSNKSQAKKIISQNWCSQRKFSQLTQLVKASPSLMVVLVVSQEYKYGMILSFLFPSIIYSVLYTEVGHRSGSLGLFCGRRPRQAVHKLLMLLLP